ncbi:hypothetical protein ACL7TT_09915 [Microbulbifer sp. 2304DJ12-6]|uniref:hypothetical protein n=1 Tax=Microbulbifer sp. 2304DJ12-6 TaxID=3233340 RepID=UPI0039AFB52C
MSKFEEYQLVASLWCIESYTDSDRVNSLRSETLAPQIDIRDYNISVSRKKDEIDRIHKLRKTNLTNQETNISPAGRILRYYPDRSLEDGLVFEESGGFISEDESPPWDTWFYFEQEPNERENILYCWIPLETVQFISEAMKSDCYDCLVWHV